MGIEECASICIAQDSLNINHYFIKMEFPVDWVDTATDNDLLNLIMVDVSISMKEYAENLVKSWNLHVANKIGE